MEASSSSPSSSSMDPSHSASVPRQEPPLAATSAPDGAALPASPLAANDAMPVDAHDDLDARPSVRKSVGERDEGERRSQRAIKPSMTARSASASSTANRPPKRRQVLRACQACALAHIGAPCSDLRRIPCEALRRAPVSSPWSGLLSLAIRAEAVLASLVAFYVGPFM